MIETFWKIAVCNNQSWWNEIIRCHLPIVDMNDVIWQIFIVHCFLLMLLLENATSPWGQSREWVLHKHSCIHHSTCAFGTRAVICMHLCLCKTHSRDCPHGEIRHTCDFYDLIRTFLAYFWPRKHKKTLFLGLILRFSNLNVLHKGLLMQDWVFRLGSSK